jgi:hypothetical protein
LGLFWCSRALDPFAERLMVADVHVIANIAEIRSNIFILLDEKQVDFNKLQRSWQRYAILKKRRVFKFTKIQQTCAVS